MSDMVRNQGKYKKDSFNVQLEEVLVGEVYFFQALEDCSYFIEEINVRKEKENQLGRKN
jgi:hypothetical protein